MTLIKFDTSFISYFEYMYEINNEKKQGYIMHYIARRDQLKAAVCWALESAVHLHTLNVSECPIALRGVLRNMMNSASEMNEV